MYDDNNSTAGNPITSEPQDDAQQPTPLDQVNQTQDVPSQDIGVEPDTSLNGYQEDLNAGTVQTYDNQNYGNDTPLDATQMPEDVLKQELDGMAFGEAGDTNDAPNDTMPNGDDMREHVEDMDKADK